MTSSTSSDPPSARAADPLARGIIPTAVQSLKDLAVWDIRVPLPSTVPSDSSQPIPCIWVKPPPLANPFTLLLSIPPRGYLSFFIGFTAWTADAFDFHSLSIQTVKLATYYGRSKTDITTAITLTLLLRSVGAALFGLPGDRWGRKWPLVGNMIILGLLQIATIYCTTFQQFLGVRSLFGLFMGGVYGNAVSMALEHCPLSARGLMSGVLQQGYSLGYVLAASANLSIGGSASSWKRLFWAGAGLSIGIGLIRAVVPESAEFIAARDARLAAEEPGVSRGKRFWINTKEMIKKEWRMCVYCIILMTWFNYFSHTTQDSYTTFMLTQKQLSNKAASTASILMKTGACVGGTVIGYLSQFLGRRRSIILSCILTGALIPAWILPTSEGGLSAGGFMLQFFVQGAWGVVPIHLSELSPPAFRSSFLGITYQLGNMISSPAAQIVNAVAESIQVKGTDGSMVDGYGVTMGVATGIIAGGLLITTALGPERRGRTFEGFEEDDSQRKLDEEKGVVSHVEKS